MPPRLFLSLFIPLSVLFAVVVVATIAPTTLLWGVHHLGYYPAAVAWFVLAFVALTFVPAISRRLHAGMLRIAAPFADRSQRAIVASIAVAIVSFVIFMRARSATLLLGDGEFHAAMWRQMIERPDIGFGAYVRFLLTDYHQALSLGSNIHSFVAGRWLQSMGNADVLAGTHVFYALLGALLVLALLLFVRRSRAPLEFRAIVVATVLLSGAMELFFGYIEIYTPMYFAAVLYLMASYDVLHGGRRVWPAVVALAVALYFNLQAALFAPSLVVLLVAAYGPPKKRVRFRTIGLALALGTVVATIVMRLIPATSGFFVPLVGADASYGVFSPAHQLNVANELMLVIPMGALFLGVAIAGRFARDVDKDATRAQAAEDKSAAAKKGASRKQTRAVRRAQWAYNIALVTPCILFLLFFRSDLGMVYDWDLYVLAAAGIGAPGLAALRNAGASVQAALPVLTVPAIALSAAIVIPWIGVNASETRSVARYEDVIARDETGGGYVHEILAMHFRARQQWAPAAERWGEAYERSRNPRYLVVRSSDCFAAGDSLAGAKALERCVRDHPTYDLGRRRYIEYLIKVQDPEELLRVARGGMELNPSDPYYCFNVGVALYAQSKLQEAASTFEACKGMDGDPQMMQVIDALLMRIRESSQ